MDNQDNIVSSENAIKHIYIDVDADVMSKPTALCDLIMIASEAPAVVFANTPSEADMIENVLNKNNIKSVKLIGHVPYAKVADAAKKAREGEASAVVVTDVASREMDIGSFKTLINYSIHEDPEIYLHRYAGLDANSKLAKIISLVSPQDFGNFHYIKKIMDFPFDKGDLPDKSDFYKQQAAELIAKAAEFEIGSNQKLKVFVEEIEKAGVSSSLLAYLLNQAFTAANRVEAPRRERAPRNNNRYDDNNYGDDGGERQERYQPQPREPREPREELPKFSRIYIGQGSDQGLNAEKFQALINDTQAASEISRLTIRDNYGFVDVPMDQTEDFIEKMKVLELADGEAVYLKKATIITALRENNNNNDEAPADSEVQNSDVELSTGTEDEEISA